MEAEDFFYYTFVFYVWISFQNRAIEKVNIELTFIRLPETCCNLNLILCQLKTNHTITHFEAHILLVSCERMSRPADTEQYTANNCPIWVTGPWRKVHLYSESNIYCTWYTVQKGKCIVQCKTLCYSIPVFREVFGPRHHCSEEICNLPTCHWLLVHRLRSQRQVDTQIQWNIITVCIGFFQVFVLTKMVVKWFCLLEVCHPISDRIHMKGRGLKIQASHQTSNINTPHAGSQFIFIYLSHFIPPIISKTCANTFVTR